MKSDSRSDWNKLNLRALAMSLAHELDAAREARAEFKVLMRRLESCGTVTYRWGSHGQGRESHYVYKLETAAMVACMTEAGYVRSCTAGWEAPEGVPAWIAELVAPEMAPQLGDMFIVKGHDVELYAPEQFQKIWGDEYTPAMPKPQTNAA